MATKKRRYNDGGKATTAPAAPAKKKSKLMLGGLGGLIPMAIQKEGLAGLSPAAMVMKYGPEILSPIAMATKRKRQRPGEPPAPASAAPAAAEPPQRIIYPSGDEGGMKRGGKVKPKAYAKGGKPKASDYDSGYRSGKDFYSKSRMASSLTPSEKGGSVGKIARGIVRATVIKPTDALVKALSHTGVLTDDDGTKASPAYVKGQLKARKDTVGYAAGGKVSSRGDGIARKGKTKWRYI